MLAADKLLLKGRLRQKFVVLKEKEFYLHHGNFNTIGTQAAVLAGFSVTALVEFGAPESASRCLKFLFYVSVVASLAANVLCVGQTTLLSVYGSSLATRGPDGAMVQAVDGMYGLRRRIFRLFNAGMFSVLLMGIFGSWILFRPLTAFLMTLILAGCIYAVVVCQRRIVALFHFAEDDAVSFDDLMEASERLHPHDAPRSRTPRTPG